MKEKLVYNINDLAGVLGKSRPTLWRMIQSECLPRPMKRGGHFLGWRKETINAWLIECEKEVA